MNKTTNPTHNRIEKLKSILEQRTTTLTVVAENIADPHNLSAILRTCDAVGVLEVCLLYHGGQATPKLSEASSAGSKKWIDRVIFHSVDECYEYLWRSGKKIYTTHMAENSISLYDMKLTKPVALVFGNEHKGVTEEALAKADGNFLVPQVGAISSLNVSVAAAVTLYEAFRQRRARGKEFHTELSEERFNDKLEQWLDK